MGRPSLLTPDVHDGIMKMITAGVPFKTAAEAHAISYQTFQNWRIRGRDALAVAQEHEQDVPADDEKYVAFFEGVPVARANCIARLVLLVSTHAVTDYRAALRLLAVYDPQTFADRRYLDVALRGPDEGLPADSVANVEPVRVLPDVQRASQLVAILDEAGLLADDG
jgi:hypothetical protein